jgi:hypothetical protein
VVTYLVDQGFVTYDLAGGAAITAGRYDSMLGFEAFRADRSVSVFRSLR